MGKNKFKSIKKTRQITKPKPMSNFDLQKTLLKKNMTQEIPDATGIKLNSHAIDILVALIVVLFGLHFNSKLIIVGGGITAFIGLFALARTVFRIYGK